MPLELALLIVVILLGTSIAASKLSTALGLPALAVFIAIGMLAGSEGLGGIHFDNAQFARNMGIIALVSILFSGGLDTSWQAVKPVVVPGILLSTIGVLVTAVIVGLFACYLLNFSWYEGLLLGSIVSSTDAAAVFGVLRSRTTRLKHRLGTLIEFESGSNDPMAIFLTIGFTSLLLSHESNVWTLVPHFFQEMALGGVAGVLLGRAGLLALNWARLEYTGLYSVLTICLAFLSYSGTTMLGGNGFLSVYLTGVVLGSHNFLYRLSLIHFHDALAWLMQIAMFMTLGLLVFPSQLVAVAGIGLLLAAVLIFVARPLAVFISLIGFERFDLSNKLFISWAGLRGAVPIVLATIPLTAGVTNANLMFNIVFFVVLASVLLQGSTLGYVARKLKVAVNWNEEMEERMAGSNLFELALTSGSPVVGKQVVEIGLPLTALIVLLTRGMHSYIPRGSTVLESGDRILLATRKGDILDLKRLFLGDAFVEKEEELRTEVH